MKDTVKIVLPHGMLGGAGDPLSLAMSVIGVGFGMADDWNAKYGANYENDVFLMKRYCWCGLEGECPWCTGCAFYQEAGSCNICSKPMSSLDERLNASPDQRCDYSAGRGIFARFAPSTLDHQRRYYDPPNFWFKPTDFRITWYKYIGRGMVTNKEEVASDFLERVFATHPRGMTLADAIAETERQEEATARSFAEMFSALGISVEGRSE